MKNPYCFNIFSSNTCTDGETRIVPNVHTINGGIMCEGCFDSWVRWLDLAGLFTALNPAPKWDNLKIWKPTSSSGEVER